MMGSAGNHRRLDCGDAGSAPPLVGAQSLDRKHVTMASFVIEAPAGCIYFVGDSGYGDGVYFRRARDRYGPFSSWRSCRSERMSRAGLLRDQHMNPRRGRAGAPRLRRRDALASHFGTFQLTDEAIDAPPLALADALKVAGIPPERFRAPRPGQVWHTASNLNLITLKKHAFGFRRISQKQSSAKLPGSARPFA